MKRKYFLIVMTVLALSISGCGKEAADNEATGSVVESSQSSEESKETEESKTEESKSEENNVESFSVESSTIEESTSIQQPVENKKKTLEEFYSQPLQKLNLDSNIKVQKEENAETLSDMGYEIKGNVFINWYQYKNDIDVDYAVNYFNSFFTADLLNPMLDSIAKESGVEDVTIQYIYKDKDGNEIYNKCFVRGQVVDVVPPVETEEVEPTESIELTESAEPTEEDNTPVLLDETTLEDIYSSPVMVETLNSQVASLKESYAAVYKDIAIEVKGNTMIYKYQYAVAVGEDSNIGETLGASLSSTSSNLIKNFKTLIKADDIAVRYIFTDVNNVVLFDETYTE